MTVPRRRLGTNGPSISQITYGSMRLTANSGSKGPADHLCHLHDLGVDTHHSSHEYDSHPAYIEALARARQTGRRFQHIVKLSEPGFDHDRFEPSRLTKLLDGQLSELNAETVASVQWLFRTSDPQDSQTRTTTLADQADDVSTWAATQIDAGKMQNLSFFPYSSAFAETVMDLGLTGTPAMYLNLLEREAVPFLERSDGFIAIRPLAGGRLVGDVDGALRYCLLHPKVTTSVLSVNSSLHVERMLTAASTRADREAFDATVVPEHPDDG